MNIWIGVLALAFTAVTSEARVHARGCASHLGSSPYGHTLSRDLFTAPSAKLTLEPEPGSVEDRAPGTVRALFKIVSDLSVARDAGRHNADDEWPRVLPVLAERLGVLADADPRLTAVVARIRGRILLLYDHWGYGADRIKVMDEARQIKSNVWELLVACLFDGRVIHVNKLVSDLFPNFSNPSHDREIDVAIERWDGSWRWIEIKDWIPRVAAAEDMQEKLFKQARGLGAIRQQLEQRGHAIQHDLVMRYGLEPLDLARYRTETSYDEILFVYPGGDPVELAPDVTPTYGGQRRHRVGRRTRRDRRAS